MKSQSLKEVLEHYQNIKIRHPENYASRHEAYGILMEEVDELWDEIKTNAPTERFKSEVLDAIVVLVRVLEELC